MFTETWLHIDTVKSDEDASLALPSEKKWLQLGVTALKRATDTVVKKQNF